MLSAFARFHHSACFDIYRRFRVAPLQFLYSRFPVSIEAALANQIFQLWLFNRCIKSATVKRSETKVERDTKIVHKELYKISCVRQQ